jgi:hypothetical protein
MKHAVLHGLRVLVAAAAFPAMMVVGAARADSTAPPGRTIAYVATHFHWAIYQTPGAKTECPNGLVSMGPREQFRTLFPEAKEYALAETQLAREAEVYFPSIKPEPFPYPGAEGKIAYGANLDGKVDPNDFVSPEGEQGVDNNLYRAIGCIINYRGPDGFLYVFTNQYMEDFNFNRVLIELTNVDSLVNDDDVNVTFYRGRDRLIKDATGENFLPGGTQRINMRWGKKFIRHFKGKIVDGVLTTEPVQLELPAAAYWEEASVLRFPDMRLKLKLTPDHAEGLMVGFVDVESFYDNMIKTWSTHHYSYGQQSQPSVYRALRRLADGIPDPATGMNQGISFAAQVRYSQVFVMHPNEEMAGPVKKLVTGGAATR